MIEFDDLVIKEPTSFDDLVVEQSPVPEAVQDVTAMPNVFLPEDMPDFDVHHGSGRASNIIDANRGKNFVNRIVYPDRVAPLDRGNGITSTHSMGWGEVDGKYYVYPTVVEQDGKLVDISDQDPLGYALETGETIEFDDAEDAAWFSSDEGYKQYWNKPKSKEQVHYEYHAGEAATRAIEAGRQKQATIYGTRDPDGRVGPELSRWLARPTTEEYVTKQLPEAGKFLIDYLSNNSIMGKASILITAASYGSFDPNRTVGDYYRGIYAQNQESMMSYKPNEVQDAALGALAITIDYPLFNAFGVGYNVASRLPLKYATMYTEEKLVQAGMTRALAKEYTKGAVMKLNSVVQPGVVLSNYAGIGDLSTQFGEGAKLDEINWEQNIKASTHSGFLGLGVGVFGLGASYAKNNRWLMMKMMDGSVSKRLVDRSFGVGTGVGEVGIFTIGDAMLDSERRWHDVSKQDVINMSAIVLNMRAMHSRAKPPSGRGDFSAAELEVMRSHVKDFDYRDPLGSMLKNEKDMEAFLKDKKVPFSAKAKIYEKAKFEYEMPIVDRVSMEEGPEGTTVSTYAKDGTLLQVEIFSTGTEAMGFVRDIETGISESGKLREMANLTRSNQTELDAALIKAGIEGGVTNEQLSVSSQLLPSQRTPEQKKLAEKLFDAYEQFKAEKREDPTTRLFRVKEEVEPASIEELTPDIIKAAREQATPYTTEEIELGFETIPRLQAKLDHPENGINKMLSDLAAIGESGSIRSKTMRNYFPEVKGEVLNITSKEELDAVTEKLQSAKNKVEAEINRRIKAEEPAIEEGRYVLGRKGFDSKKDLFLELDKFESLEGTLPEVHDFETATAIREYEVLKGGTGQSIAGGMKATAEKLRGAKGKLKPEPGSLQIRPPYMSEAFDFGVEMIARTIEAGAGFTEGVGRAIDGIKAQKFYKDLTKIERKRFEKALMDAWEEYYGEAAGTGELTTSDTYQGGADAVGPKKSNILVKTSKDKTGNTLLVQIHPGVTGGADATAGYFEQLYKSREGYWKSPDFWEVPTWAVEAANSVTDADFMAIRDPIAAAKHIAESGYSSVMFSVMDVNKGHIKNIAEELYKLNPDIKVVAGGYVDGKYFKDNPNVKFFDTLKGAVEDMGYEFKEGKDTRHFKGTKTVPRLCLSKGCRHKCAFCTVDNTVRAESPESIDAQIESFKDYNYELVYVDDKTFGQAKNADKLKDAYNKIKEANPDFRGFIIQTTAPAFNKLDPKLIKESGIKYVELGVESYNDEILKNINKPHRTKTIDQAVEKIREQGLQFIPNIIVGMSGKIDGKLWSETAETYANTMAFKRRNEDVISHVNVYNLAAYKGTELGEQLGKEGDINENVVHRAYHKDAKIHEQFYQDVVAFGERMLEKGPQQEKSDPDTKSQLRSHKAFGGSTFTIIGENLMGYDGASVSIFPNREQIIEGREITERDLIDYIDKNRSIFEGNEDVLTIGTWKGADGKTYIDVSSTLPLGKAVDLGNKYGQKAIYDLKNGETITLVQKKPKGKLPTEASRIAMIRSILGIKPPKTTIQKRIDKAVEGKPIRNRVLVSEYAVLKDQIKMQSRIAKDIAKFQKKAREDIQTFISTADFSSSLGVRTTKTIARRLAGMDVNDPGSVIRVMDYIDQAITDAKFREELAEMDRAYDKLDKQTAPPSYQKKDPKTDIRKGKGMDPAYIDKLKAAREAMVNGDWAKAQEEIDALQEKLAEDPWGPESDAILDRIEELSFHGVLNATSSPTLDYLKSRVADIESIRKQGRTLGAAKRMVRSQERRDIIQNSFNVLNAGKKKVQLDPRLAPDRADIATYDKFKKLFDWVGQDSWFTMLDKLSKFDKSSAPMQSYLNKKFGGSVIRAEEIERHNKIQFRTDTNAAAEKIWGASGKRLENILRNNSERLYELDIPVGKGKTETRMISMNEAIKKWQETKDLELVNSMIAEGYFDATGEPTALYRQLESILTPRAKEWGEWQMDVLYPKIYDLVNEVYRDIFSTDMPQHKKYSPIFVAEKLMNPDQALEHMLTHTDVRALAGNNHLKVRTPGHGKMLLFMDADKVMMNYMDKMLFFQAWAKPLREMNAVFGDRTISESIRQNFGEEYNTYLKSFLQDFGRRPKDITNFERWATKVRSNFTIGSLAIKPTILIKQLTSFPAYADNIPTSEFVVGLADFATNYREVMKVLNESEYIKERYKVGWDRDVVSAMQKDAAGVISGKGNWKDFLMFNVKWGDKGAIVAGGWPVYRYHYNKAIKEGLGEREARTTAMREFEFATRNSQQASNIADLSYYQRANPVYKWFTMYKTSPLQYHRKVAGAARNLVHGRGDWKENMKTVAIYHFLLPQLFQMAGNGFKWDGNDQAWALIGNFNNIFIAGDAMQGMMNHLRNLPYDYHATPLESLVTDANRAIDEMSEYPDFMEEILNNITVSEFLEHIDALGKAASYYTGRPVDGAIRTLKGLADAVEGNTEYPFRRILGYSENALEEGDELWKIPKNVRDRIEKGMNDDTKSWDDLVKKEGNPETFDDLIK